MGRIVRLVYPFLKTSTKMGKEDGLRKGADLVKKVAGRFESASSPDTKSDFFDDNVNSDRSYVTFVPMVSNNKTIGATTDFPSKPKKEDFSKLLSAAGDDLKTAFTPNGFKKKLSTAIINKSDSIYISLPAKPVTLTLSHKWTQGNTIQMDFSGGTSVMKLLKAGAINKAVEIVGKSDLVRTAMSSVGVNSYSPKRAFFGGTEPIKLTFDWDLSPKNRHEATIIKKIITSFKVLSTVQSLSGKEGQAEQAVLLSKNPAVWRIDFDNASKISEALLSSKLGSNAGARGLIAPFQDMITKKNSFDVMVCTGVTIKYGDGDFWTTFDDGFPNVVKLSLSFDQMFPLQSAQDQFGEDALSSLFSSGSKDPDAGELGTGQ